MIHTLFKLEQYLYSRSTKQGFVFFLLCTVLLSTLVVLFHYVGYSFLFSSPINELQQYYPRWYWLVYTMLKIIELFYYTVVVIQLYILSSRLFANRTIKWVVIISGISGVYFWEIPLLPLSVSLVFLYALLVFMDWELFIARWNFLSKHKILEPSIKLIDVREKWIVLALVVLAFLLRLLWILLTDNSGNGDAGMRLFGTQNWIFRCSILNESRIGILDLPVVYLFPSRDWLPLHYYLMYAAKLVSGELIYSSRILTALFGALSVIPIYKLAGLKFNRTTALISALILTFYLFHIYLSSLVLSEPFYIFFLLWAYYFIENWRVSNNNIGLVYIGLMLACLNLLRFEGWFFSACCVVLLPLLKNITEWRKYLYFLAIVFTSIIFVMYCEVTLGEHPLRGILYSDYEVKATLTSNPISILGIITTYRNSWLPLSFLGLLFFSAYYTWKYNNKLLLCHILYVIPLFPFIYKLFNGTLTAQPRYMLLYMVPLIPFVAYFFYLLYRILRLKLFFGFFIFYLVLFNVVFYKQLQSGYPILKYPSGFHKSATFVRKIEQCSFYIDADVDYAHFNWNAINGFNSVGIDGEEYRRIKAKLKLPDKVDIVISSRERRIASSVESNMDIWRVWNSKKLDTLLYNKSISHIVIFPNGTLNGYLKFSRDTEKFNGYTFIRLCNFDGYMVYEVIK